MKKQFFATLAMATALTMFTACSSEDAPQAKQGGEATVTFSVQLPGELNSRYGDGAEAQTLKVAVYDAADVNTTKTALNVFKTDAGTVDGSNVLTTSMNNSLTKNIQLQLASGKTYTVVCWADAGGATYTFDPASQSITANYGGVMNNDEKLDAFYGAQSFTVNGDATETVQLRRPFAQLNIGAQDFAAAEAAGYTVSKTEVKVTVPNSLNLTSGVTTGSEEVTFASNDIPAETVAFPSTAAADARYLSMTYLLAGADKGVVDVDFNIAGSNDISRSFSSVPVQRNYRTNIYGNLLTNTVDFTVEIVPAFEGTDNNIVVASTATDVETLLNSGKNVMVNQDIVSTNDVIAAKRASTLTIAEGTTISAVGNTKSYNGLMHVCDQGSKSTFTIDGKGTLKAPTYTGEVALQTSVIEVRNGGNLTVNGNVTFDGGSGSAGNYAIRIVKGTVTINGGYFTSGTPTASTADGSRCEVIYLESAYAASSKCELYINGGVFESKGDPSYMINIRDAYRSKCKVEIRGGIFVGFNPANNIAEGKGTSFVADGYTVNTITYNGKTAYEVVKGSN